MTIILAIDPASISAAAALFLPTGIITKQLLADKSDNWTKRIGTQRQILMEWLSEQIPDQVVDKFVVEEVGIFSNAKLSYSVGALASVPQINSDLFLLGVSTWKSMAKRYGCTTKDPKGKKALAIVRPDIKVSSDDEADAVLIGLAFLERGW
jgi:hypothetical protein